MTKKEEWLAGTRSAVPIMLGYVPVGIAYGVMARQAGLNTWQTVLMSLTVYGGASEMMAAGMVAQGAAVLTIVLTTFILNLRHIIMSTCVFNQMQGGRLPVRMLAAFGVTDETFAVYTTTANAPRTPRYFFSMALCSYLSWALGSWLGAIATGLLPPLITAALGISLYAMFIGLLMPGLHGNGRLAALVVLTALCNTVLCNVVQLDSGWSMILSTLGCAALGSFFVTPNAVGEEAQVLNFGMRPLLPPCAGLFDGRTRLSARMNNDPPIMTTALVFPGVFMDANPVLGGGCRGRWSGGLAGCRCGGRALVQGSGMLGVWLWSAVGDQLLRQFSQVIK